MRAESLLDKEKDLGVMELSSKAANDPEGPRSLPETFYGESKKLLLREGMLYALDHEIEPQAPKFGHQRLVQSKREYDEGISHMGVLFLLGKKLNEVLY